MHNFRNYRELDLDIPPGVVVFYGANGQGKTNLLEAIYLLLRGESFRPMLWSALVGHEAAGAPMAVHGHLKQEAFRHDLSVVCSGDKKARQWNGRRAASHQWLRQFPVVLFSPESLSAIKSGPDLRRQLLDDLVATHSSVGLRILRDYRRALLSRNRLLKQIREAQSDHDASLSVLQSLDPIFLPLASELTWHRLEALRALQPDFARAARSVLHDEGVDITVEYLISSQKADHWNRSDILSALHNRAQELRRSEVQKGASLVGPHQHDVRFLFAGKDSRFFCSQGQQRALILSFKMAQILYHYKAHQIYPLLLLDDVLSELDPIRRTSLVSFLKDIPAQIFLTTTDVSFTTDFGDRRLHLFHISEGRVLEARSLLTEETGNIGARKSESL